MIYLLVKVKCWSHHLLLNLCLSLSLRTGNPRVWCKLMCLHLLCFLLCCFPSSFETGSSASNSLFAWGCSWTQVYSLCLPSVSVTDDYRYASPYLCLLYFLHGLFPLLKCRGCLYLFWIILGPSWFYHIKMPMPAGFELSLALVN